MSEELRELIVETGRKLEARISNLTDRLLVETGPDKQLADTRNELALGLNLLMADVVSWAEVAKANLLTKEE